MTQHHQTQTQESTYTISRVFDAPRERVFAAWADCERIKQWWGPREWPTTSCKMDFRRGGTWHYGMTGPDGQQSWGLATYKEIKEPELILYVDAFSNAEGAISTEMPQMTIRVEFADQGERTAVTSRTEFASAEEMKKILEMGAEEGFKETWDRLEEYLAKSS